MPTSPSQPRRAALRLALALAVLTLLPVDASAQYFGRNKVQWEQFDWRVLQTTHFDIYYYPEEERAVRDAALMAERWYDRLSRIFEREFFERKSLVLYADQSDFQQTTVVRGSIGQGTGGVTEGLKTRVVLPFAGNYEDTDHVLGHELVHVFQYDILQDRSNRQQGGSVADIPLWFIEGLAEYLSLGRESAQTAMWLRDAVARDEVPTVRQLSRDPRLFPYRWGHAFWAYVGGRWGDVATTRLFILATQIGLEAAMEELLGLSSEEFSEAWQASIRETYRPVLAERQAPEAVGTRIFPREEESDDVYIAPALSPDGDQVVFISSRSLFSFDLYLADARTGEIRSRLVSSDTDPHFDSLRFLDSAGAWSPDSRKFAFVVFAQGDNELAIVDIASRNIERRIPIEGVGALWNPAWSPDGRSIAFSGSAGGLTDIFLHDLESGTTRRLTNDAFSDLQPSWSPDGRTLAFISDRGAGENLARLTRGAVGIWLMDASGGQLRQVATNLEGDHYNPRFGPEGRDLFFLSDRDGVSDLYRVALDGSDGSDRGQLFRVTRITTGVTGITRLSPALTVAERSGRVMFSVFQDSDYQIHSLEPAQTRGEPVADLPATAVNRAAADLLPPADPRGTSTVAEYLRQPGGLEGEGRRDEIRGTGDYRPRLQLDFVGPSVGVGYSSLGYGFGGDITAFFSDVLGQREVGLTLQGGTGTFDELGGQGYYLDQSSRWQWGAAGGHVPYISAFTTARNAPVEIGGQVVEGTIIEQVLETVTVDEASFITRYPFSTTRRFEFDAGYTQLGFDNELRRVVVVGNEIVEDSEQDLPAGSTLQLFQSSAALVGDSSFFGFTSPVRGRRYRLEAETTFGDLQFQSLLADYRRYFFARPVTLAVRGLHLGRYGTDAESERLSRLYVGRPTLVRGYEVGDFNLEECTVVAGNPNSCPEFDRLIGSKIAVANLELRVPLFGVRGFGLIELPFLPTELAAFVDAGVAWTENESPELRFERDSIERVPVVSAGLSARVLLGGFAVLQFYYARPFQRADEDWVTGFVISPGW